MTTEVVEPSIPTSQMTKLRLDGGAQRKARLVELLHKAASQAVQEEDPWAKYNLPQIPAERIIRHLYDPLTQTWNTDETIVKMEAEPFTHGAMRFCYRMKKRAQPPRSATNHRFHKHGWSRASNYVAKCYQKDGAVDTSEAAKHALKNDIVLQYEAQRWAAKFNNSEPPSKISFIRAYAIEFPNREGHPWFAVERFIAGKDSYGAGFVKHNTNSGFVDTDLRRVTPQVFSAHSFYASEGHRLVADIQGVGDLYTDPQVLSSDYRFGDGDLGPRGMALFFKTFRPCGISDAMGIPVFPLSKNELKVQAKYHDDEVSISDDEMSYISEDGKHNIFQKLDLNRMKRRASLMLPSNQLQDSILNLLDSSDPAVPEDTEAEFDSDNASVLTEKRSNLTFSRADIRASFRKSFTKISPGKLKRTKSDVDEVQQCLSRARQNWEFDLVTDYHRTESGELRPRKFRDNNDEDEEKGQSTTNEIRISNRHKSALIGTISPPMKITVQTKLNLGKVHYQLSILHGLGRFPEVVPDRPTLSEQSDDDDKPPHDSFSVLFHLSYAASLQNAPACLSLGRVHSGLGTHVSELLDNTLVPLDFDAAKDLLRRAMEASSLSDKGSDKASILVAPIAPSVTAGCLLFQILQDERVAGLYHTIEEEDDEDGGGTPLKGDNKSINATELMQVAEDTLELFELMERQEEEAKQVKDSLARTGAGVSGTGNGLQKGDRVEGDYFMEGTYYPGTVLEVSSENGQVMVTVQYDDDGSSETLTEEHVRLLIPPTATQTNLGGPLSDEEAFGAGEDQDDKIPILKYELLAELAELKQEVGDKEAASMYYQQAAESAMQENKMKTAAEWSLKAAELQD